MTIRWSRAERGVLGWIIDRLGAVLPQKSGARARRAGQPDVFLTRFHAPLPAGDALRKAATFALPQLLPLATEELIVFGRTRKGSADIAAVRKVDLEAERFRKTGWIVLSCDWIVPTPRADRAMDNRLSILALAVLVASASIVAIQNRELQRLEVELAVALEDEAHIRSTAKAAATARNEADLWASLKQGDPQARSPAQTLVTLASLSRATPDHSSWTKLTLSGPRATIEGRSRDAVALLAALSDVQNLSAKFSKPVIPLEGGVQQFEIQLAPEEREATL